MLVALLIPLLLNAVPPLPLPLDTTTLKSLKCECDGTFSPNELYDALGLKRPSWYQFWKDKEPKVNPLLIPSFQGSLTNYYKSEGFYHVKIQSQVDDKRVIFDIHKGAPVIIAEIKSNLPSPYKEFISYHKGERFKAKTFIEIKKKIKNKLLEEGYCNANFESKARIDIEKNIAFIRYNLTKNSLCHFGDITIDTPKNIDKKVIASRLYFAKGSPYSSKLIKESYSTISGLEAFDGVQIISNRKSDIVDLSIRLKAKKKRIRKEVGIGFETDLGPKGVFRWEERNYKGGGRKLSFDLKYSKKEKHIKNSFFWPAFLKVPFTERYYLDLKNDFIYSLYNFENFREEKYADYLHFLKDYYHFSIDLGVGIERIDIKKTGGSKYISTGEFFLLFPFIHTIIDNRDSKINPRNGTYFSAYLESGLKYLASSTSYSKFLAEARLIKTVNAYTFAAKGKLGLISEFEKSLPESKLFFAGGAFSNRAYGFNRLGAMDSNHDESGAKTLIDTSLEMSHPLYKNIEGALFYDATMISEKSFEFTIDFVHALGVGLRYMTPIGPVKIDLGVNIEHKEDYALHFQIGQSF